MQDDEAARVATIMERLHQAYPDATCALHFSNPLELLVATILSAQCTDERVNAVTGRLFTTYRSATDYANAPPEELEAAIKPTGFYRSKARHIQAACRLIGERHNGEVPRQMEQLTALPGVARKTANVVLGNAYGVVDGVVVDTHVGRVARRLGLTASADPLTVEADLMAGLRSGGRCAWPWPGRPSPAPGGRAGPYRRALHCALAVAARHQAAPGRLRVLRAGPRAHDPYRGPSHAA